MAKKKKAKQSAKKKANKTARKTVQSNAQKKKPKPLPTDFLVQFDATVITKDNPQKGGPRLWCWPPAGADDATSFATIGDVVKMLGKAYTSSKPPVPDGSGPFQDKVAAFAGNYPWPANAVYGDFNKPGGPAASTVNLYEIAQVADLMLQAIDGGGDGNPGGGGTRWPPVK